MHFKRKSVIPILRFQLLFVIGIGFGFFSCAGTSDFLTSVLIPDSRGYVKVSMDNKKQYVIKVRLKNLLPLHSLSFPEQSYVVWMVSDKGINSNIGVLKTSSLLFAKINKATFRPGSGMSPAKIYITAEDNPWIQNSNTEIVFSTSTFRE